MPFRMIRREPSLNAPEHVTSWRKNQMSFTGKLGSFPTPPGSDGFRGRSSGYPSSPRKFFVPHCNFFLVNQESASLLPPPFSARPQHHPCTSERLWDLPMGREVFSFPRLCLAGPDTPSTEKTKVESTLPALGLVFPGPPHTYQRWAPGW